MACNQTYIQRIKEVNETVHAVTELNTDALKIAATLDCERSAGKYRGYAILPYKERYVLTIFQAAAWSSNFGEGEYWGQRQSGDNWYVTL